MELGYTPENLTELMSENQLTIGQVAKELGVCRDTVSRWRASLNTVRHVDMPHYQWVAFLDWIEIGE